MQGDKNMLKRMELTNYKSFKNVTIDFSDTKTKTKNIAIIYGENGSGKSNIISSLYFLKNSINTLSIQKVISEIMEKKKEYTAPKMTIHNLVAQSALMQTSQPDGEEVSNTEFD